MRRSTARSPWRAASRRRACETLRSRWHPRFPSAGAQVGTSPAGPLLQSPTHWRWLTQHSLSGSASSSLARDDRRGLSASAHNATCVSSQQPHGCNRAAEQLVDFVTGQRLVDVCKKPFRQPALAQAELDALAALAQPHQLHDGLAGTGKHDLLAGLGGFDELRQVVFASCMLTLRMIHLC